MLEPVGQLWVWRHPRAQEAAGRCIGRTDLGIDRRRAKRLAHRIRHAARQRGLPRRVLTSPLRRCAAVGQWLRRWGWRHERLPALLEMDFGRWDGLAWSQIPNAEVDAWCAEFLHHRPGGGETLQELFARVAAWQAPAAPVVIVAHAGWMLARRWLASAQPLPVRADQWPVASRYGECWTLPAVVALPPSFSSSGGIA
jgi:alpha-ribazole phosphatase